MAFSSAIHNETTFSESEQFFCPLIPRKRDDADG